MRYWLLAAMLAAAACDRPATRSETRLIAEEMADAHMRQLEGRVAELEAESARDDRIDESRDNYAKAIHSDLDAEKRLRADADNGLIDHYNDHLTRFHGAPRK